MIHKAVLDACDALDGVKDGVLEDPTRCRSIQRRSSARWRLVGVSDAAAGRGRAADLRAGEESDERAPRSFQDWSPAAKLGWVAMAGGPRPLSISNDYFRFLVFKNPDWDFKTLDFDKDVALADRLDAALMNATDPNLSAFVRRGGRLLMYHGWNDQLIAPRNSINYYQSVVKALGGAEKAADSIRLFMVPGMGALRRRRRHERVRQLAVLEAVGGTEEDAGADSRVAPRQWRQGSDASVLSVSVDRRVHGLRRYQRRRELHLQDPVAAPLCPLVRCRIGGT